MEDQLYDRDYYVNRKRERLINRATNNNSLNSLSFSIENPVEVADAIKKIIRR